MGLRPCFWMEMDLYRGMAVRTSCPSLASATGSAPATSARPPVLAYGTISEDRNRIFTMDHLEESVTIWTIFVTEFTIIAIPFTNFQYE